MESCIKLTQSELQGTEAESGAIDFVDGNSAQILSKLLFDICLVEVMVVEFVIETDWFLVILSEHAIDR